jgi:hypothetical protein
MLEFTRMVTVWYSHVDDLSTSALLRLFRGGALLAKVFGKLHPKKKGASADESKAGAGTRSLS